MTKEFEVIAKSIPNQKEATELMEKLVAVGSANTVFSEPVESGEYTVITAAEARVAMGFGFGGGGGTDVDEEADSPSHGARVEPIIDPTKIALAFLTTLISIFTLGARLRKGARG